LFDTASIVAAGNDNWNQDGLWHIAAVAIGIALGVPVFSQDLASAVDVGTVAQGALIQGTMEGHADRARPKTWAEVPAFECSRAWARREQITRAERRRLYDLCPG
jgi:hypothetical protein